MRILRTFWTGLRFLFLGFPIAEPAGAFPDANRCQAIKGTDERADEYIICGAIAPYNDTRGPIEAHLCGAHHELFKAGGEVKIAMGTIGRHGIIGEKLE